MGSKPGTPILGFSDPNAVHDGNTDRELLSRFVAHRDGEAFAALVRAHGPMVLGLCRRILHDAFDAEDAFQATFLVLVRKAGSIRRPEQLANWLYGVAYRTALKARAEAAKRRARERLVNMPAPPRDNVVWSDLLPVLDEELNRLPAKYRLPFVLCHLEGKTNEEAARQLGCPRETIATRLARARQRLRARLTRRGLTLSTAALATLLSQNLASATVPSLLLNSTVHAAVNFAASNAALAGGVSAQAAALTKGVLQAMFLTKLRIAVTVFLIVTIAGVGVGLLCSLDPANAEPNAALQEKKPVNDQKAIQGTWKVISAEFNGKEGPDADKVKKATWTIKADKIIVRADGEDRESTYKLDPSKKPKAIDIIPLSGGEGEKGKTFKGIYLLEGKSLKICFGPPDAERPTEFTGRAGAGTFLFVLKRQADKGDGK